MSRTTESNFDNTDIYQKRGQSGGGGDGLVYSVKNIDGVNTTDPVDIMTVPDNFFIIGAFFYPTSIGTGTTVPDISFGTNPPSVKDGYDNVLPLTRMNNKPIVTTLTGDLDTNVVEPGNLKLIVSGSDYDEYTFNFYIIGFYL